MLQYIVYLKSFFLEAVGVFQANIFRYTKVTVKRHR